MKFGAFEVDFASGELRKSGASIRLQEQPYRILEKLLERPGELVTREQLRDTLWPSDTFVDFERSLNAAVAKLRVALGDSADRPLYVETVARKGYRFIAPVTGITPPPETVSKPRIDRKTIAIAAIGACLALLALTLPHRDPTPGLGSLRFTVAMPDGLELAEPSYAQQMAISPDGRTLAVALSLKQSPVGLYNAAHGGGIRELAPPSLWLRPLASEEMRHLEGTEGATRPFWSPTGSEIGFFAGGKLKKVAIDGGPVQTLCDAASAFGASWGRDGTILFSTGGPLLRVSSNGGSPIPVTRLDAAQGEFRHAWPEWLPDGRFLYFLAARDPVKSAVLLGSPDGGPARQVLRNRTRASFVAPDRLLFVRDGILFSQKWNPRRPEDNQTPTPVATGVNTFTIGQSAFSASANGVLVYRATPFRASRQLAVYGRDGRRLRSIGAPGPYTQAAVSPDEQTAALTAITTSASPSSMRIWLMRLSSEVISRHDFGNVANADPAWSPDSRHLAVTAFEVGDLKSDLLTWTVGQPDQSARRILSDGAYNSIDDWSPDGRYLLIRRNNRQMFRLAAAAEAKPEPAGDLGSPADQLHIAPSGAHVAFNSVMSGRPEVTIAALPGFTGRLQVSNAGGVQPLWRKDGRELFYISPDGTIQSVKIAGSGGKLEAAAPTALFKPHPFTFTDSSSQYAVSGDGQRFYVLENLSSPSDTLHVITHWQSR